MKKPVGNKICKGPEEAKEVSMFDFFLLCFLLNQLEEICTMTTRLLHEEDAPLLVQGELIKFPAIFL